MPFNLFFTLKFMVFRWNSEFPVGRLDELLILICFDLFSWPPGSTLNWKHFIEESKIILVFVAKQAIQKVELVIKTFKISLIFGPFFSSILKILTRWFHNDFTCCRCWGHAVPFRGDQFFMFGVLAFAQNHQFQTPNPHPHLSAGKKNVIQRCSILYGTKYSKPRE